MTQIASLPSPPHVILPLNTAHILKGTGFKPAQMTELDWWEGVDVRFDVDGRQEGMRVTGAPAQHFTSRGLFDRSVLVCTCCVLLAEYRLTHTVLLGDRSSSGASLWSSIVLEPLPSPTPSPSSAPPLKFWFAGDTGYSALPASSPPGNHEIDYSLPVCPAFKEIGDRWGGFDLALIPIGAYEPRGFMSPIHCDSFDSVRVFKDVVSPGPAA